MTNAGVFPNSDALQLETTNSGRDKTKIDIEPSKFVSPLGRKYNNSGLLNDKGRRAGGSRVQGSNGTCSVMVVANRMRDGKGGGGINHQGVPLHVRGSSKHRGSKLVAD